MSTTGDVIRRQRERLQLSQDGLGQLVGVGQRQIARFESGASEPSLSIAARLATALDVSLSELAGVTPRGLDLSGVWWAGWQTWKDDVERVDVHELTMQQNGAFITLDGARARPVSEGSYEWRGEMKLWDNEILMGWYIATDGAVRSKGSLYAALHPHGHAMIGSWTGLSYAGLIVRGWSAIARDRDQVEHLLGELIQTQGNLTTWPKMKS
ncbi:helix-turn-helix domain-containing protein [Nocardia sp. NBC_00508]|uniref:helix-turn-helix domain-containing protein n=1 Tax=Nocardia sp. NBC_00508 TaxID=2975992 RepID=UPI002E80E8C8|nr:helix-turn-helix transcriptional regulator [Nocardia sp. NBC_00508]WUD64790.1 helix-turn-helix domain-containing protein [Nocardia sp. NBC_00508]